ncbi:MULTISPECIES: flagellar motor switch protein FliG [Nitrosomonas]|uniref:Flagellar motor switch protein FliG n=2 Tax=Nitrosomonas eutropha TaxID=916 RepID=A0ABX5M7T4_9PROT|nr:MULTISPECIES: flagellar motor switch protein FliG [Nitrosomonas]ABI59014.1 flagellar motor switch protein FliG [Nitrosomonas eutropha C91]MXS80815.1 flagellar motor switch protein FliG [Nitrosomonas sp. GH22]PXV82248.1 flagellar motor switch protein FliG [Nitrosomonas eutropha]SCX24585.1 flagellar motor switch protein FliG [Nitrosomonas eutropha]SDW41753.1 flagellar motor switch protein FliG [Nitrosomonas eutropha]
MNDEGILKSAILLMSLGEEEASRVFRYLGPKEVQKLSEAMAALNDIKREKIELVLEEFCQQADDRTSLGQDGLDYLRNVLIRALGEEKAANLLDRINQGDDTSGIESLKWMDAIAAAELIKNEHPQIIATILVHLERDQSSTILAQFAERLRNDVLLRIATLDSVQPIALRELNGVLSKLLSGTDSIKKPRMGGVRTTAEILNFMPTALENSVIENFTQYDEEIAQRIMDEMFVFDDLLKVDDQGIQLLLREIQSDSLITALKGAKEELRSKIFRNMSQRAAEVLREDLESKGPVRVSEVEAEQKKILKILRQLADDGRVALGGRGEDGFL